MPTSPTCAKNSNIHRIGNRLVIDIKELSDGEALVELVNSQGRVLFTSPAKVRKNQVVCSIDSKLIASNIYYVRVRQGKNVYSTTFIEE